MPWNPEREPTDERADFVEAVLRRHAPFAQICQHFEIRLETGYKWLARATSARPQPLRGGGAVVRPAPSATGAGGPAGQGADRRTSATPVRVLYSAAQSGGACQFNPLSVSARSLAN